MFGTKNLTTALLSFIVLFFLSQVKMFGQPAHDPSHMVKDGGRYWIYATGDGIWSMSSDSSDFTNWKAEPPVFPKGTWPSWINNYVPGFGGTFWAPEVTYMNGQWRIYYACSTFGSQQSAIGMASADSLAGANWQDQGMVVYSNDSVNVNAIDPDIFRDDSGKVWLLYGSYWDGIVMTQIDSVTGKPIDRHNLYSVANGGCEAGNMLVHDGYYYLFFNRGACCQGVQSTYHILMGRSTSPTGPFYDKDSINTYNSYGGSVFLHSDGRFVGPGQFGYGQGKLTYHYYDAGNNGFATLGVATIEWKNGWPVAVYKRSGGVANGEYVIENRNSSKALDLENGDTVNNTNVLQNTINLNASQIWMVKYTGDGYYEISPSLAPDKSLDVTSCSGSNGANVQLAQYDSAACQQWYFAYIGSGIYRVMAHNSLKALEIANALTSDGANARQWSYNKNATQNWMFKNPNSIQLNTNISVAGRSAQPVIYPNPSHGSFTIDLSQFSGIGPIQIKIYTIDGNLVYSKVPGYSTTIKISNALGTGVYLLKIITMDRTVTRKIMVK